MSAKVNGSRFHQGRGEAVLRCRMLGDFKVSGGREFQETGLQVIAQFQFQFQLESESKSNRSKSKSAGEAKKGSRGGKQRGQYTADGRQGKRKRDTVCRPTMYGTKSKTRRSRHNLDWHGEQGGFGRARERERERLSKRE